MPDPRLSPHYVASLSRLLLCFVSLVVQTSPRLHSEQPLIKHFARQFQYSGWVTSCDTNLLTYCDTMPQSYAMTSDEVYTWSVLTVSIQLAVYL